MLGGRGVRRCGYHQHHNNSSHDNKGGKRQAACTCCDAPFTELDSEYFAWCPKGDKQLLGDHGTVASMYFNVQ